MKTRFVFSILGLAALMSFTGTASAAPRYGPSSTAFTFQGHLTDGGSPADGVYDFALRLYDGDVGGSQVGETVSKDDVTVTGGLFTVELDFGHVFDGTPLWLEIGVRPGASAAEYTVLSPRQRLTATPYALHSALAPWSGITGMPAGFADGLDDNTTYSAGTGLSLLGTQFSVDTTAMQSRVGGSCAAGNAIRVVNADGSVTCESIGTDLNHWGQTWTGSGTGLTLSGGLIGLSGTGTGTGVHGVGGTYGVYGNSDSGTGVLGMSSSAEGVYGSGMDGVVGIGTTHGVNGYSANGMGVYGQGSPGVYGTSTNGNGITGVSSNSRGVYGTGMTGVYGAGPDYGMYGISGGGPGVAGYSTNSYGLYGNSTNSYGVYGTGTDGVYGTGTSNGVYGYSSSGTGVYGQGSTGVYGTGSTYGMYGMSTSGSGVYGYSSNSYGLYGHNSANGAGVYGESTPGDCAECLMSYGVKGVGPIGVYAQSTVGGNPALEAHALGGDNSNFAAVFHGSVNVYGYFDVYGSKSAVVDTQDYGQRKLYAVESPESWFEDFGTGQLTNGEAVITIEPIFAETVNLTEDYHVYLTPRGDCALYVDEQTPASFTVRGMGGQTCTVGFHYRIVAKRLGYEDVRLAEVNTPPTTMGSH